MPAEPSELAKAKLKVMAAVPYIQKQKAGGLKYSFAGEAAIIEKLHPALREAGLTLAPTGYEILFQEAYKTGSGTGMNRVIVRATFVLTHADSGQSEAVQSLGEGADSGDKATSKAMTGALKYALRQSFLIETGDDPDNTPSEQQERAAPARQPSKPSQQAATDAKAKPKADPKTAGELYAVLSNVTIEDGAKLARCFDATAGKLAAVADYPAADFRAALAGFLKLKPDALDVANLPAKDHLPAWNFVKQTVKRFADAQANPQPPQAP